MAGLKDLNGKWVLVTGAAAGIGLATAKAFSRRGANLVITDVDAAGLASARSALSAAEKCMSFVCNVGDEASVNECAHVLASEGIVLDVLVNNAGVAFIGGFMETPLAQWQRILNINVIGCVLVTRAFLPAMQKAGGSRHIINIASTAAYLPAPNMSAYAASKGAVKQFSEVLAMELAETEITVQCVYPGVINTAIVGKIESCGANIKQAQLDTLQSYYVREGASPDVVGEDIVTAVLAGTAHVCTGPMSLLGNIVSRLAPLLARKVSLKAGRSNGYLPAKQV
jgi:short-subunit dehydrogenase